MTHAQGEGGGRSGGRLSFSAPERKKVLTFAALGAVCLVIVAFQVCKRKGPATAEAAPAVSGTAAAPVDLDQALQQMRDGDRQPETAGENKALCRTVDEAMELFLGDVKAATLPADKIRFSAFGLPEEPRKSSALAAAGGKPATAGKEQAEPADPVLAELNKLNLETVLVSARNRAAIINGQVLHCGETVNEFKIVEIEPGRVSVERGGKKYALLLK